MTNLQFGVVILLQFSVIPFSFSQTEMPVGSIKAQSEVAPDASTKVSNVNRNLDGLLDKTENGNTAAHGNQMATISQDLSRVINTLPTPGRNGQGLTWDGKYLWSSDIIEDTMYKLDPVTGNVLNSFPVNYTVSGIAWDGVNLLTVRSGASVATADTILKWDPDTGALSGFTLTNFDRPQGITWDGQYLWVNDFKDGILKRIDPDNGQLVHSIPAPGNRSIGLAWDGHYLWSDDFGTHLLYQIEPEDGSVVRTYTAPHENPRDLTWDGKFLRLSVAQNETLYQIDVDSRIKIHTTGFALNNFPNPFNPSTTIRYSLDSPQLVVLVVYNQLGQIVRTLVKEIVQPGVHSAVWDGKDFRGARVSSGIYFYRLTMTSSRTTAQTRKMIFLQ